MKRDHGLISAIRNEGALLNDYFLREELPRNFQKFADHERAAWAASNLPLQWRKAERRLSADMSVTEARDIWYDPLLSSLGFTPTWTMSPVETERGLLPVTGFQADNSGTPIVYFSLHAPGTDIDRDVFSPFAGGVKGSIDRALDTLVNQIGGECRYAIALYGRYARLYRGGNDVERQFLEVDFQTLSDNANREEWLVVYTLLNAAAFAPDESQRNAIERMQVESVRNADKVADDLSANVRDALEALAQGALDNPDNHPIFGGDITHPEVAKRLYSESLYVLYRLLFALYSEARGLFDLNNAVYHAAYSVEHLRDLVEQPDSPLHGDSFYIWESVKALFSLIHQGAEFTSALDMPRYNGQLFDPEQTAWLGQCCIADSALRKVIRELSLSKPKGKQPRRRIAYGLLGVTQFGYIYEKLLALKPIICAEPWVTVECRNKVVLMPLKQARELGLDYDAEDGKKFHRKSTFLLASWDGQRKGEGTFFTREYITRYLVEETLLPFTQGRSSEDILRLKVCDPAMGSGTFLVPAARYLTREYIRALREEGVLDEEPNERKRAELKREIVTRCLYGVDISPQAVELAKVSLWLETADSQMPLDFLDEHLRYGNSLIGAHPERQVEIKGKTPPRRKGEPQKNPPTRKVWMTALIPQEAYSAWIDSHDDKDDRKEARDSLKGNRANIEDLAAGQLLLQLDDLPHKVMRSLPQRRLAFQKAARTEAEVHHKVALSKKLRDDLPFARSKGELNLWCAVWFWPPDSDVRPPTTAEYCAICETLANVETGLDALSARQRRQWEIAQQVAEDQMFFHWHLEFPEVFDSRRRLEERGFDAILSNPPWNTIKPYGMEFFCQYDPTLHVLEGTEADTRIEEICGQVPTAASAWRAHRAGFAAQSAFYRESGVYDHIGFGDLDTYKLFCERIYTLLRVREDEVSGRAGVVMSGSLHKALGARDLRELLYTKTRVDALFKFDNEAKWFVGIDHRVKFDLLIFEKGGFTETLPAVFAAFLDPPFDAYKERSDDLLPEIEPYKVHIPIELIRELSPEALSPLEFSNQAEIEVCRKMCRQPLLGAKLPDKWQITLTTDLHMTGDKEAFHPEPEGFPLYEGKMFDQFDHRAQTYQNGIMRDTTDAERQDPKFQITAHHYVHEEEGRRLISSGEIKRLKRALLNTGVWHEPNQEYLDHTDVPLGCDYYRLAYRDIASSVVWRTTIATLLPPRVFCGHTTIVSLPFTLDEDQLRAEQDITKAYRSLYDGAELCYVVGMLNAFVVDWFVRFRVGGHLTYGLFDEIPMPRLTHGDQYFAEIVRRCGQLVCTTPEFDVLAAQIGLGDHHSGVLDPEARLQIRCELDAYAALLYDLTIHEFAAVLDSFRVYRDQELVKYAEFRSKRLCLEAFARLTCQSLDALDFAQPAEERSAQPRKRTAADRRYQQARVLTDLALQGNADEHLGRVKIAKETYAVQEIAEVDLGYAFSRAQLGPLDTDLYRVETLARRQGWLLAENQPTGGEGERVVYRPGALAHEAAAQAARIYGDRAEAVRRVLEDFRTLSTRQAEHWTTVHFVWKELKERERPFTVEDLIEEVWGWKGHRQNFTREHIAQTVQTLVHKKYIAFDGGQA